MNFTIDDTEGKLGQGFLLADDLEEVTIRFGDRPRLAYVSAKLYNEFKKKLIKL